MHIKHMSIEKNHQDDGEDRDELLTENIFLGDDLPKQPPQPTDKNPKNDSPLPLVHSDLDEYGLDPYEFRPSMPMLFAGQEENSTVSVLLN
jgi:hypothetical protein